MSIFKFEDDFAKNVIKEMIAEPDKDLRMLKKDTRYKDVKTYHCYNDAKNKYTVINPFDYLETRK